MAPAAVSAGIIIVVDVARIAVEVLIDVVERQVVLRPPTRVVWVPVNLNHPAGLGLDLDLPAVLVRVRGVPLPDVLPVVVVADLRALRVVDPDPPLLRRVVPRKAVRSCVAWSVCLQTTW